MTRPQRLLSLAFAAVIAVVALVLISGGGDPTDTASTPTETPTPSATAAPPVADPQPSDTETTPPADATPTPTPRPRPPLLTAGSPRTLRFAEGETIRFRVRSATAEEVHVHGYDRYADIPAGRTRTLAFEASITGIFEVELHGSGTEIGRLRVEPG